MTFPYLGHAAPLPKRDQHVVTSAGPALVGVRGSGTQTVVPIPLGSGLSIDGSGNLIASGGGGGGGGTWGSITGTLSAQTDLQAALDAKAALSHTHVAANITDLSEAVDDRVAALLVAGTSINISYNDGANSLTISASGARYTYGTTAPLSPSVGDRWFNSTQGIEYTWVDDGTSAQWVDTSYGGIPLGSGNTSQFLVGTRVWDNKVDDAVVLGNVAPPTVSTVFNPPSSGKLWFGGHSYLAGDGGSVALYANCFHNASNVLTRRNAGSALFIQTSGGELNVWSNATGAANDNLTSTLVSALRATRTDLVIPGRIQFPSAAQYSTDPNALDQYSETGTEFTPTLTFGGGSVGMTYSVQTGRWVKVGKLVYVNLHITLSAKGSSTGTAQINALPFTVANNARRGGGDCPYFASMAGLGGHVTTLPIINSTSLQLFTGSATGCSILTDANFTNTSDLYVVLVYEAAN